MIASQNFLWDLSISDELTLSLSAKFATIAMGVATICFVINLSYNYFKHGAESFLDSDGSSRFPDYMEIARCMVIMFCLTLYVPITKVIVGSFEVINEATELSTTATNELSDLSSRYMGREAETQETIDKHALKAGASDESKGEAYAHVYHTDTENVDESKPSVETDKGSWLGMLNPVHWVAMIIHALASLILGIIELLILGANVIIVKVLVILGSFAFAFSILPPFRKQLEVWFGTLCSVCFSFVVINVLNHIVLHIFRNFASPGSLVESAHSTSLTLCIDITLIGAYCSVYWLSSKIVGHGDAGKIIGKTAAVITSAAMIAVTGGSGAGKAAAGKAAGSAIS